MPTLTKLYSMKEVSEHNTKQDGCAVEMFSRIICSHISFVRSSSADEMVGVGKDSIEEFEDAGHSEEARELLETFFIGVLDLSATTIPEASSREDTMAKPKEWLLQYWAIPVTVVGISMVVGFLYLQKR
ncbi:hypothetical protein Droror1_Dr00019542 [Drosera rotundifolia]